MLGTNWMKMRAEERAGDRGQAADHDADQQADRQDDGEAVGRDELHRDRAERAGHAGVHRADTPKVSDLYSAPCRCPSPRRRSDGRGSRPARGRRGRAAGSRRARTSRTGDRQREEVEPLVGRRAGRPNGGIGLDDARCPARRRSIARCACTSAAAASPRRARRWRARGSGPPGAAPAGRTGSRRRSTPRRPPAASPSTACRTCPSGSPRRRRRWRRTRRGRARSGRCSR